jgi:hypothetical protein
VDAIRAAAVWAGSCGREQQDAYLAVASTSASAVTFMAVPGHEQAKDAMVIAQAYGVTASTAFADGRGPGGLADEERQFAACPVLGEEASDDQ